MRARRARRLPEPPLPAGNPDPLHTCVGLGDAGAGPRSRLLRLGLLSLRYWILHLGLGLAGRQGKREKAVSKRVPPLLGTQQREGTWDTPT